MYVSLLWLGKEMPSELSSFEFVSFFEDRVSAVQAACRWFADADREAEPHVAVVRLPDMAGLWMDLIGVDPDGSLEFSGVARICNQALIKEIVVASLNKSFRVEDDVTVSIPFTSSN